MILEQELVNLLNNNERELHDFKSQQYSLTNDDEKSKLIKDIISFSNRVKLRPAYIIIGTEEVSGRGQLTKEALNKQIKHLKDNNLQQLVKEKVDVELKFSYYPFSFINNKEEVGILEINRPVQKTVRCTKDFGILKKDEVYIRVGSVNEVAKPAWIDILKNEVLITVKPSGIASSECSICKTGGIQPLGSFQIDGIAQLYICDGCLKFLQDMNILGVKSN